ncbi:MAG: cytidine deaminase [Anaerolineae bacterium]|nr:cytidine deaminase [Anaerolineales bacterium]MCQ3979007.1 cytidine deaminase [Anaerolineae bacterium]
MNNLQKTSQWDDLLKLAIEARENSYSPYSHYKVGAALLTTSGKTFTGCNIENAAYTPSNCAERTAIFKAVSEGERDFAAIAVATSNSVAPCGVCRQVMREFAPNLTIILGDIKGNYRVVSLTDLLPDSFGPENLETD